MSCDRFETGILDHWSGTATRVEFILRRTVCVTKLDPKSLNFSQIRKVISVHNSQDSTVERIQLCIRIIVGIIKTSGYFRSRSSFLTWSIFRIHVLS